MLGLKKVNFRSLFWFLRFRVDKVGNHPTSTVSSFNPNKFLIFKLIIENAQLLQKHAVVQYVGDAVELSFSNVMFENNSFNRFSN